MQKSNKKAEFVKVTNKEELAQCLSVSKLLFGSERGDIKKHLGVLKKNPETYYMLKENEEAIGYTAMWPINPVKLADLLSQTISVKITPDDIETFEKGKTLDIYINVIGIKPGFTKEEKRIYGSRLIAGLIDVIINLGKRGIIIHTIAARSNMPDGIRIMKGIGFTEIEPATPERRTFVIRVQESGIPFVMQYKQALKENEQV